MFKNLKSLTISKGEVDFKSLLPKIISLTYLNLGYDYIE
jgi:hypothetical protein